MTDRTLVADMFWAVDVYMQQRGEQIFMQGASEAGNKFILEAPHGILYHGRFRVVEGEAAVTDVDDEATRRALVVRII